MLCRENLKIPKTQVCGTGFVYQESHLFSDPLKTAPGKTLLNLEMLISGVWSPLLAECKMQDMIQYMFLPTSSVLSSSPFPAIMRKLVMSRILMSHVTHVHPPCHITHRMSHVTRMHELFHTYACVISHVWIRHATDMMHHVNYLYESSHTHSKSHVTYINESSHTYP